MLIMVFFCNVIVGKGSSIPIHGTCHQTLPYPLPPLHLKNVLHTPKFIKNLLYIRRPTTDNNVSVEFDPSGFDVKNFLTQTPFLQCNNNGDLFPFTIQSASQVTQPFVFCFNNQIFMASWPWTPGRGCFIFFTL